MCHAQGQNALTPVRLALATPRSQVKHSTTEPLHFLYLFNIMDLKENGELRCSNFFCQYFVLICVLKTEGLVSGKCLISSSLLVQILICHDDCLQYFLDCQRVGRVMHSELILPPPLKRFRGHIAFGFSSCSSICLSHIPVSMNYKR